MKLHLIGRAWALSILAGATALAQGVLTTQPQWSAAGDPIHYRFGYAVAGAGDVNGDGYPDVLVGAPADKPAWFQTDPGSAYAFHGGPNGLSTTPDWSYVESQPMTQFGASLSGAGDVDGDGYADVIIGAYTDNIGGPVDEGRAFLFRGGPLGLERDRPTWVGGDVNVFKAHYGADVAGAGDLNGDGHADVLVGVPGAQQVHLYLGNPGGLSKTPSWTTSSDALSLSSAGDVNADGFTDALIGRAVFLGGNGGLSAAAIWTSPILGSASAASDTNGDGFPDILVGDMTYANPDIQEGRAVVFLGGVAGIGLTPVWSVEGNQYLARLAYSAADAGDINDDGFSDIVVGSQRFDNGQTDEGRALVYLGSPAGPSTVESWIGEIDQADAHFGHAVASAGDVNGNGHPDVIVGAPEWNRAFLFLGGPDCNAPAIYGTGTPGSGGITPSVTSFGGLPQAGNAAFGVQYGQVPALAQGLLGLGLGQANLSVSGITLLLDPALPLAFLPVTATGTPGFPPTGIITVPLPLPNAQSLVGVELNLQLIVFDPGAPAGLSASPGLHLTICNP